MQSASSLTEVTIYAVKWLDKFKFFRSEDSAMDFVRELQQWADKLNVSVDWEIESIYAEVE